MATIIITMGIMSIHTRGIMPMLLMTIITKTATSISARPMFMCWLMP